MEQPARVTPTTRDEFYKIYWFTPLQMVTLINPKETDYPFMVEMRNYVVKAGAKEKMPGTVANVYLSQMTRILAQDEDKMQFLSDYALMTQFYDRLIVSVENLIEETNSQPAYMSHVPPTIVGEAPDVPPWQEPVASSIPQTNSNMSNEYTPKEKEVETAPTPPAAEPGEKEFELNGEKYRMLITKDDKRMYYKDGKLTTAAEYNKAVSML